ncbi:hypothetical protein MOPEL_003_01460 [Mobilicoccus pelagius NBRC 104925]|uniref:Uncharacterized protein n=1 Tax=Mobilicoccus pelagius NBRC 104925 TaxID=1089455 RepID=H5UN12_9MICO|nr:hypothetical protein MOPEL_003_01460 [Mobilicoccus pelagius NBRC 104925]
MPSGTWILVLESYPKGRYSADDARAKERGVPGPTTVVDSSLTPGLRPGYWAVVSDEWFSTKPEANRACGVFGRSASGACYARLVG